MMTSESVAELVTAMARAQAEYAPLKKTSTVKTGTYSYTYASLPDLVDSVRPALAKHGLMFSQATTVVDGGGVLLVTRLFHTSGQWLESVFPLRIYDRPQETGSALSYAKRYALGALLGIAAEEDDDGAEAQNAKAPAKRGAVSSSGRTALPSSGAEAVSKPAAAPISEPHAPAGALTIVAVEAAPPNREGKVWYRVKFSDGREGVTAADDLAERASDAARDNTPVQPELKPGQRGRVFLNGLQALALVNAEGQAVDAHGEQLAF